MAKDRKEILGCHREKSSTILKQYLLEQELCNVEGPMTYLCEGRS